MKRAQAIAVLTILGLVGLALVSCRESKDDPGTGPVVPEEFAKAHKAEVDAFRAKLDAAGELVKDLPATSVKKADPDGPFVLIRTQYIEGENAFIVNGYEVRTLPELGLYEGKDMMQGKDGISIAYSDYLDLKSASLMAAGERPRFQMTGGAANYLAKRMSQMRYVIIGREVSYVPGTIDKGTKTFVPGTYEGVAHVVDLQGPKHLGSVAFKATSSGKFESFEGSEEFIFKADLQKQAIAAFIAEMKKVFPAIEMPELAK